MNRLEETITKQTVLQAQLNACAGKIEVLAKIDQFRSATIDSAKFHFSSDPVIIMYLKTEEEAEKLKAAALEILEARVGDE